eukprot:NODE_606_length_5448_cov_0.959806.p3 type:complete len:217 gc:universal NODE_606_length_5448_cov_0.959806:3912-3262(-)
MPTVLITGANRGMGLEYAKYYFSLNYKVYGTMRNISNIKNEELSNYATIIPLELTSEASIRQIIHYIDEPLDLLISNAAIYSIIPFHELKQDSMLNHFKINAIGPILLIQTLLPLLNQSKQPQIIIISSKQGSISLLTKNTYEYPASRTALHAMIKSLSLELSIPIKIIDPGLVKTKMSDFKGDMTPNEAIQHVIKIIDSTVPYLYVDHLGNPIPW